jgi:hypothetical protein
MVGPEVQLQPGLGPPDGVVDLVVVGGGQAQLAPLESRHRVGEPLRLALGGLVEGHPGLVEEDVGEAHGDAGGGGGVGGGGGGGDDDGGRVQVWRRACVRGSVLGKRVI